MPPRARAPKRSGSDDVRFFATPARFRAWLEKNHATATELWVGFHRKGSGKPSITWPQSVDEALCFGWIDGIRKTIDESSYRIRFTPRRKQSIWSNVNIGRISVLEAEGRMTPAGRAAFAARTAQRSGVYAFEQAEPAVMGESYEGRFRANAKAWAFWEAQPPYYRKIATRWVTSAKQEATRDRRLERLIADSAAGLRIGPMRRPD